MKKTNKKRKFIRFIKTDHDSHYLRKILLLTIIAISLMYGMLIMGWGRMIARDARFEMENKTSAELEKDIRSLVQGYPIEKMIPYIARHRKETAAFLVSVAKKESDWGKHVPILNGRDCYNYWGYRDQSDAVTWDGYTCFSSPQQAVSRVSQRFNELINDFKLDTPKEMVVWKCGWDCADQDPESVSKWISDVNYYFQKII